MVEKEKAIKEVLEWIERRGGANAFAEEADEFQRLIDWFYAHREELVKEHPDQWVGMYQNKVVVAGELEDLIERMEKAGIPRGKALVEFLNTKEEDWIP
ncbi:MAG: hypothetical protein HY681_08960 [Chloroflexi bacterium]|nr:hypothetical protein [Chloroflexota bacterium]